jgi:methyl-accepting chemotaxis protein
VLQAIILLAIFFSVRKFTRSLHDEVEDLRTSVLPIILTTRETIVRIAPKIEGAVDDFAKVAQSLRTQTAETQATINDIVERVHKQSERLDEMVSGVMDAADRASNFVVASVSKPVRKISGLMAAVKAVVETLRTPPTRRF